MKINHKLVNQHKAETHMVNGHAAVILPLENGFHKLIAYFATPQGEYLWVHQDFRKRRKSGKKRE